MTAKERLYALRRELTGLFLLICGAATVMGVVSGRSLGTGLFAAVVAGIPMFLVVATVFLILILGTDRQVRLLQGLFVGLVAIGVAGNLLSGRPLQEAIGFGFITGGLTFLSVATLLTIMVPVYLFGKYRGQMAERS
jgi:hypothetical protein